MRAMPRVASLLITTMLVAAPALAQQTSSPAPAPAPAAPQATTPTSPATSNPSGTMHKAMPHSRTQAMRRQPGESLESLVDRRIADLHSKLHITPEQSAQWDQFAQVMRDNAKQMDQMYQDRAKSFSTMSAVDNMQSFAQIEQQRADGMQKLVPAFQAVYSSLSDQQKKVADQLFRNYSEHPAQKQQKHAAL